MSRPRTLAGSPHWVGALVVVVGGLVVVVGGLVVVVGGFVVVVRVVVEVGGFDVVVVVVVRVVVVREVVVVRDVDDVDVRVEVEVLVGAVVVGPAVGDGSGDDGNGEGDVVAVVGTVLGALGDELDGEAVLGAAVPVDAGGDIPGVVAVGTAGAQPTAKRTTAANRDRAPGRLDMCSPWASKLTGA